MLTRYLSIYVVYRKNMRKIAALSGNDFWGPCDPHFLKENCLKNELENFP